MVLLRLLYFRHCFFFCFFFVCFFNKTDFGREIYLLVSVLVLNSSFLCPLLFFLSFYNWVSFALNGFPKVILCVIFLTRWHETFSEWPPPVSFNGESLSCLLSILQTYEDLWISSTISTPVMWKWQKYLTLISSEAHINRWVCVTIIHIQRDSWADQTE